MANESQTDKDALELNCPEVFLKRERTAQRVGMLALSVFVVAGVAGAFGDGPLSRTRVQSGNVTLAFQRFTRQSFRTDLEISITGSTGTSQEIHLPREFLRRIDMLEVRPANTLKRLEEEFAVFEVPVSNGAARLALSYAAKSAGVLHVDIDAGTMSSARVRQIVYF